MIAALGLAAATALLTGPLASPARAATNAVISGTAEATSTQGTSIVTGDTFAFTFTLDLDSQAAGGTFNSAVTAFSLTAGAGNVGTWSPAGVNWQISPAKNVVTNENSDQLTVQVTASDAPALDGKPFLDLGVTLDWNSSVVDVQPTVNGNSLGTTLGTFAPDVAAASYFFELRANDYSSASYLAAATSSGGGSAAPQVVSVDLDLEAAELPASWSPSATLGSWYQLPASADVVGVGENAGKNFLGVATSEDFPVAIAQRQVDNGWGVYEIYDADGRLASVFIPAGKSLHLTAVPRLHAIWSQ